MSWVLWVVMGLVMVSGGVAAPSCPQEELTMYRVALDTHWSPRDFPKHYPEWRPPAQWSKLIGLSHAPTFVLFRAGEVADQGVKEFSETASTDLIDQRAQLKEGVLDAFTTPPITQGVGTTEAHFFVDGNHSRVSLMSKIVPSPDWFVGVDSFELCEDGNWVNNVKIQVDPLDAGTDNGLTFTSPNWPTSPSERIFRITANYPDHPAHSFYYPTLTHLPRIATFTITKVKEYSLREHLDTPRSPYDLVNLEDIAYKHFGDQNRVSYVTSAKSLTRSGTPTPSYPPQAPHHDNNSTGRVVSAPHPRRRRPPSITTPRPPLGVTEPGIHNSIENAIPPPKTDRISMMSNTVEGEDLQGSNPGLVTSPENHIPSGNAMAVIDDIVKNYQKEQRKKRRKQRRKQRREDRRRRQGLKKIRPPRDCKVSGWSEWSPCSKTCGIGEQTRTRTILRHARRGGKVCPVLDETTWCGSARACRKNYFDWSSDRLM